MVVGRDEEFEVQLWAALFLLPHEGFRHNSFQYERAGKEPLQVVVGYRGHAHPYSQVITPSVMRKIVGPVDDHVRAYKTREGYAGNLLREAYFRRRGQALQDLECAGILQHHKTIGPTDVLDLSNRVQAELGERPR